VSPDDDCHQDRSTQYTNSNSALLQNNSQQQPTKLGTWGDDINTISDKDVRFIFKMSMELHPQLEFMKHSSQRWWHWVAQLGRWSWMKFQGKRGTKVLIITAYQVSQTSAQGLGMDTVYMQH
jgi:hypothetical protein